MSFRPLHTLVAESELTLINSDIALDYPRVGMPHVVNVGGITTRPAQPLPSQLQQFIQNATHGVILVSMGSVASALPVHLVQNLVDHLQHRPEKIIIKYSYLDHVPDNVMLLPWIPQNDILGHDNVKLFITHGGNNGQFEALYHGVPMLVLPVFAEQPSNARRVKYKGFGEYLSLINLEEKELLKTVDKIIRTPSYRKNIQKASRIFRSSAQSPIDRVGYWIEHVLEFGGQHLRSAALDLPLWKFLMLDVCLVFVVATLLMILCLIKCTKYSFEKSRLVYKLKHD